MPLQNRVRPDGEIITDPARGLFMGNRGGRLHDAERKLGVRRHVHRAWICCRIAFKDRKRQVMGDGYTELFFLDEATALAAGHRPCFECRHAEAVQFATLWNTVRGQSDRARAAEIDDVLHGERLTGGGTKRTWRADLAALPDGAFVLTEDCMALKAGLQLAPWTPSGYLAPQSAGSLGLGAGLVDVLTPPAIIAVLGAGYRPKLHDTAPH